MPSSAEQYLKPDVLAKVARFDLKAKFLIEGFFSGLHRSPFKGFSAEFSDHRKYVPGDDIKDLDWKVYARTNKYYIKQFEAETNMECYLVVDASASMGYGTTGLTKLEYATYLAGALAFLVISQQDSVGLITFDDAIRALVDPKSKRKHIIRILKLLNDTQPGRQSKVSDLLHQAAGGIDHRGLVVVLSDLLDEPDDVVEALGHLRFDGHDVIVFQILDAAEAHFPFTETRRFEDVESGEKITADAGSIKAGYLQALSEFIETYRSELYKRRIDFFPMDTSMSFDRALMAYLMKRSGR
ncbi:MAG: DUF58 domain-containing protein [Planctomycetota bacterium]